MPDLHSSLYQGHVMHHRLQPTRHRFNYRVFSVNLDLDELQKIDKLRFFSVNRLNLFSFHEKDYGRGRGDLADEIRQHLIGRGYHSATARIELLCYPRVFGFTFNPLSVYFCYNQQGEIEVVLYEVSNTFGSRHTYLIEVDRQQTIIRQHCEKLMYVSPFMPMDTSYQFRISPPQEKVCIGIRQLDQSSNKSKPSPILHASFSGDRIELSDRKLLKMFFKYPLMTVKVIAAIHWEALLLWRKNLRLQPRDKNTGHSISWQDKHGVTHYESL